MSVIFNIILKNKNNGQVLALGNPAFFLTQRRPGELSGEEEGSGEGWKRKKERS
jgi:hypothetical protein